MAHVTSARVQLGPWPKYAGMRGWIRSSAPVYHKTTGAPIFTNALPFTLNEDGYAELYLPFTDREVNNPANFTYEVRWISGYQAAPPARKFRLPSSAHVANYMAMQSSTDGIFSPSTAALPTVDDYHSPAPVPSAPAATAAKHVHVQTSPAGSWVIDHALNKRPSVLLFVGGQHVYSDLEYSSNARVTVVWPVPTSGEAHLS